MSITLKQHPHTPTILYINRYLNTIYIKFNIVSLRSVDLLSLKLYINSMRCIFFVTNVLDIVYSCTKSIWLDNSLKNKINVLRYLQRIK